MMDRISKSEKLILFIIISLYLILEALNIKLPGLYVDEAWSGCGILQVMKNVGPLMHYSINIFNRNFPVMQGAEYSGAMESYILSPFLLLFGTNVVALRLVPIFMQAGFLFFLYLFLRDFLNKRVAITSLILLVINSVFLLETKLGLDRASILHFAEILALYSLYKWYKGGKNIYFYFAIYILGLGLTIRIWFLWFVNSLIVLSVAFRKKILGRMQANIAKYIIFGSFSFLFGSILFVYYNLVTKFATIRYIIDNFSQTRSSVDNFFYLDNLFVRLGVLVSYLQGKYILSEQGSWNNHTPTSEIALNQMYPFLFLGAFAWIIFSILFKKISFAKNRIIFIIILFLLILLQSPFTLSCLTSPHLFILFPIIPIILSIAWVDMVENFKKNKLAVITVNAVFVIFILIECNVTIRNNYLYFRKTGGTGNYSDAIYELASYLKTNKIFSPFAMDWGFNHNLIFLSGGDVVSPKLAYVESGDNGQKDNFIEDCKLSLNNSANKYLFHAPAFANRPEVFLIFEKIVKASGKVLCEEKKFYQRDGRLVYILYSVK